MKKITLFLLSGLIVLVAFSFAYAQIPKEGTSSYIIGFSGTYKAVAMGQERVQMTYEVFGSSLATPVIVYYKMHH